MCVYQLVYIQSFFGRVFLLIIADLLLLTTHLLRRSAHKFGCVISYTGRKVEFPAIQDRAKFPVHFPTLFRHLSWETSGHVQESVATGNFALSWLQEVWCALGNVQDTPAVLHLSCIRKFKFSSIELKLVVWFNECTAWRGHAVVSVLSHIVAFCGEVFIFGYFFSFLLLLHTWLVAPTIYPLHCIK